MGRRCHANGRQRVEKNFEKRPLAAGEHRAVGAILHRKAAYIACHFPDEGWTMYASMYMNTTEQARCVQCTFPRFATTSCLTSTAGNRISFTAQFHRSLLAQTLSSFRASDGGGACSRHGRGHICARCVGPLAPQFRGIHDSARARWECFWRPQTPSLINTSAFSLTRRHEQKFASTQTRANDSVHHSFFHLRFTSASKASKSNSPPLCASAFNIPLPPCFRTQGSGAGETGGTRYMECRAGFRRTESVRRRCQKQDDRGYRLSHGRHREDVTESRRHDPFSSYL